MRLKCFNYRRLLNKYADSELKEEKSLNALKAHLETCSECKKELAFIVMSKNLISSKERLTAQDSFIWELKEKLKPEPQIIKLRWVNDLGVWSRRLIPVPVAVSILIAGLLFVMISQGQVLSNDILGSSDEVNIDSSAILNSMILGD